MRCKAELKVTSKDAYAVATSLETDNFDMGGVHIVTRSTEDIVKTDIETDSVSKLIGTIDDMIHCHIVAERMITDSQIIEQD